MIKEYLKTQYDITRHIYTQIISTYETLSTNIYIDTLHTKTSQCKTHLLPLIPSAPKEIKNRPDTDIYTIQTNK